MKWPTLIEQFLAEECTHYVRDLVLGAIHAGRSGAGPRKRLFEFNRFEVTVDLDADKVVIEDVLQAPGKRVQRVSVADFSWAVLGKWR